MLEIPIVTQLIENFTIFKSFLNFTISSSRSQILIFKIVLNWLIHTSQLKLPLPEFFQRPKLIFHFFFFKIICLHPFRCFLYQTFSIHQINIQSWLNLNFFKNSQSQLLHLINKLFRKALFHWHNFLHSILHHLISPPPPNTKAGHLRIYGISRWEQYSEPDPFNLIFSFVVCFV